MDKLIAMLDWLSAGTAGMVTNQNGEVIVANRALAEMLGESCESLVGRDVSDFTHPDDVRVSEEWGQSALNRDTDALFFKRYRRSDGSYIQTCVNVIAFNQVGQSGLLVAVHDISKYKTARIPLFKQGGEFEHVKAGLWVLECSALEEFFEELRNLQVTSLADFVAQHPERVASLISELAVIDVNKECARLFEFPDKSEFRASFHDFIFAEPHDDFVRCITNFYLGDLTCETTKSFRTASGNNVSLNVTLRYAKDHVTGPRLFGCMIDVSDRVELQKQHSTTVQQLNSALESSRMGMWDWNIATDSIQLDDRLGSLLGFEQGVSVPMESFQNCIHENDRQGFESRRKQFRAEQVLPPEFDLRLITERGWQWFTVRGQIIESRENCPIRAIGTLTEVSQSKQQSLTLEMFNRVLEMAASGETIGVTLDALTNGMRSIYPEVIAAIHLIDEERNSLRVGAKTNLPDTYTEATNGLEIHKDRAACGHAIATGELTVVRDVRVDPLYEGIRDILTELGLCSSWSIPISRDNQMYGTLCLYSRECAEPDMAHLILMQNVAQMAGLLLEGHWQQIQQQQLHDQLMHSQKLESLGRLAGGIAHDFNNLLASIQVNTHTIERVLSRLSPQEVSPAIMGVAGNIALAATRASDLCKQMMAYAGDRDVKFGDVNVNSVIHDMVALVRTSLPNDCRINLKTAEDLPQIHSDSGMLSQILLNLLTNSVQSLNTKNGIITVESGVRELDRDELQTFYWPAPSPGKFVFVSVADNGCGFDETTRERLFEPFYSTRSARGRGFGLANVLANVRQHRGGIQVQSAPGQGSCFEICFPLEPVEPQERTNENASQERVVLLVDDEVHVRESVARLLMSLDFTVLKAETGEEAVSLMSKHGELVMGVLLDHRMPGMNGDETAILIREQVPQIPILFMSAFSKQARSFETDTITGVLIKPFRRDDLKFELERLRVSPDTQIST